MTDDLELQRQRMVSGQLASRDITDEHVLRAIQRVPRHEFVPSDLRDVAYRDGALPIGHEQTISQPYIVALMTQLARPQSHHRALDVGTGCGYQAAVLAEIVDQVFSIEIVEALATAARERLARLSYENVHVRQGDGYIGWESAGPFDVILVAAAPDHVPPALLEQLALGGTLVMPVGIGHQKLVVCRKDQQGNIERHDAVAVSFVPMTGAARQH